MKDIERIEIRIQLSDGEANEQYNNFYDNISRYFYNENSRNIFELKQKMLRNIK